MNKSNFLYIVENCKSRVLSRAKVSKNAKLFLQHKRFLDQLDVNHYSNEKYLAAISKIYRDVVKDEISQDI